MNDLVVVQGLKRSFDVSSPWITRKLAREPRRSLKAVDGLDFAIRRGETFGLVGESGSGKSTLARMMVGLLAPSEGKVTIAGIDISGPDSATARRLIQMIFQDPYGSLNPRWRVGDIIAEPIRAFALGRARERVADLLSQVGLGGDDALKYPHEFSGGQRQRIAIARALASAPEFIVCDEPTSALDVSIQAQILNLMQELRETLGLTYLLITHNLAVTRFMATRVGVMYLGRLVEIAGADELFARPRHPYTRMLLDAAPDLTMSGVARIPVGGEPPNPIDPPPGCPFHPRCPWAIERCKTEPPALADGVACHRAHEDAAWLAR